MSTILNNKKAIIWDWNGTLLNDVDVCIDCMNKLLKARNLQLINTEVYREIFTFPVKTYYQKLGFDFEKEDFEKPALEFINLYYENLIRAELFLPVNKMLENLRLMGFHQSILSAMEHDSLLKSLKAKGVYQFFDRIAGINDHYAHSKVEIGSDLISKLNFKPEEILLVGDTLHDLDVATELGVESVLLANGHQSKQRLLARTPNVIDDFSEITKFLK